MTLEAGKRVGKYEIRQLLGAGGMGEVYLAHDAELGRPVALKFLPAEVASDPRRMSRFEREARAASALNHPNIITIHEIGRTDDGRRFFATEFVDGVTLREHAARRLGLGEVLDVGVQVAAALAAAHAGGIVHRDIKPENVMVRRDGYVKVLDFGLTKLAEHEPAEVDVEAATRSLVNTDPGVVMGTVPYMSPEQARGLETDARTDIWSLGVVLYELTAGRPPFTGATTTDTLLAVVGREPAPLRALAPDVPEALEWVVTKALTKEKEERYQTAREMLTDLRRLRQRLDADAELERSSAHLSDAPPQQAASTTAATAASTVPSAEQGTGQFERSRLAALALAAVVVLAGLGFGLYKFFGSGPTGSAAPVGPLQSMKFTKLSVGGGTALNAISPDGKLIARVASEGGKMSLRLRQTSAAGEREVVPPAEVNYAGVTFAPDSGSLYYVTGAGASPYRTLYRVPVIGGEPQKLTFNVDTAVTFSPDGRSLAFVRGAPEGTSLVLADADGGGEQVLVNQPATSGRFVVLGAPAWSPDGKLIAYIAASKDDEGVYLTVEAADVSARTTKEISPVRWRGGSSNFFLVWVPDGRGLIVVGVPRPSPSSMRDQLWYVSYPGGTPYQITNDPNGYRSVSLTADSRTLLTTQDTGFSNVWVVPAADPPRAAQITNSTAPISQLTWTPDGRIIYVSRASGNQDLWVVNADGSGNRQLTFSPETDYMPAASSDGRYVVFQSVRDGVNSLYRMNADGGGTKELVRNVGQQVFPQVSRDSQWVYYTLVDPASGGKNVLMRVSMDGGEPSKLREEVFGNCISPDGERFLAWELGASDANASQQMVVFPASGGEPARTFDAPPGALAFAQTFAWSPDGRGLDFVATRDGVTNVWRQPLAGGKPRQVTAWKTDAPLYWLAWSFDGKSLAVVRDTSTTDLVLIQNFR
ncbi:MAG: PD40 domain-containing protein [Acidobacteria bacterium]|nr:PD40 domain-containing protein [Acidobacteriota bacterium]